MKMMIMRMMMVVTLFAFLLSFSQKKAIAKKRDGN